MDQEVLDLDIQTEIYDITFGDTVEFPVTMRWGSRVNLTWYVTLFRNQLPVADMSLVSQF